MKPLLYYLPTVYTRSEAVFLAEFPSPVLVIEPFDPVEDNSTKTSPRDASVSGREHMIAELGGSGTAAYHTVSLGRGDENDIQIRSAVVSRYHAVLVLGSATPILIDLNSSNGSFLSGARLVPGQGQRVPSGGEFLLGTLGVRFLQPLEFFAYLKQVAESSGQAV